MEPEFLNTDSEHVHDTSVSSLSIIQPGDVHLFLMNNWIRDLLSSKAADIYRMKGVMAISGAKAKYVYQVCVLPLVMHSLMDPPIYPQISMHSLSNPH
jgi:G3E family GTPase